MSESMPSTAPTIEQEGSELPVTPVGELAGVTDVAELGQLAVRGDSIEDIPPSEIETATEIHEKSEKEQFIDDLRTYLQGVEVADDEFIVNITERLRGVRPELLGATGALVERLLVDPDSSGVLPDVTNRSIIPIFLALGLEAEHVDGIAMAARAFKNADPKKKKAGQGILIRSNIENLAAIARQNPEAPRMLADTYGIRNFYRYNPAALIRQLEDVDSPFDARTTQLIITAHADHNGALKNAPRRLEEDPTHTRTIFAEAGSMVDVARILLTVANSKDALHSVRLARLVIAAHGNRDGILLGTSDRGGLARVSKSDIAHSRAIGNLIKKGILSPHADVILAACSTGKKGGFAKIVSERIDLDIVASDQDARISITNNKDNTRKTLSFDGTGKNDDRSVSERVRGSLSRWKVRSNSSTTVYRGGKRDNIRKYTLSARMPGDRVRRLYR